jgi:predicted nuclease with TOPRIM domain
MSLTYEERTKQRKSIVSEIDKNKINIEIIKNKIINAKEEIKKYEEEIKKYEEEKSKLENKIKNLEKEYIEKGIPVPSEGNFEIENGLLGAKRDINLKLTRNLNDKEIVEVFQLILIFLFYINI